MLDSLKKLFGRKKYIQPNVGDKIIIQYDISVYSFGDRTFLNIGDVCEITHISDIFSDGNFLISVKKMDSDEEVIFYYFDTRDRWDTIENIRNKKLEKLLC